MISMVVFMCLVIMLIGAGFGAVAFGIMGFGTLLTVGFYIGVYIVPIILVLIGLKAIWGVITANKTNEKK